MFTGHYSFSFAGKSLAGKSGDQNSDKRIPLWLLFLAVQWIDVMWSIFVLLGIEKVRIVPGFTASNALDLYYMPYSHSLLAAFLWSLRNGQYEDLDGAAERILFDEDRPLT